MTTMIMRTVTIILTVIKCLLHPGVEKASVAYATEAFYLREGLFKNGLP